MGKSKGMCLKIHRFAVVILSAILLCLITSSCGLSDPEGETTGSLALTTVPSSNLDPTTAPAITDPTVAPAESESLSHWIESESTMPPYVYVLETKYGEFTISGHWNGEFYGQIIDSDPYVIRGFCNTGVQKDVFLFDVIFGSGEGEFMGYISSAEGGFVPVYLKLSVTEPDGSWTVEETQDFYGMLNEVNSILSQVDLLQDLPSEPVEDGYVEVPTSLFVLSYPVKFADRIRAEVIEGQTVTVSFYGTVEGMEELYLYDILLNSPQEGPVGYYTTASGQRIAVHISNFASYSMEGWTDSQMKQMNEMLESVNDVLFALEQTGNFGY